MEGDEPPAIMGWLFSALKRGAVMLDAEVLWLGLQILQS